MNEGSKLMAVDVDDVLVHIATPWVRRALRNPKIGISLAGRLAVDDPDLEAKVLARPQPHIQQWLIETHGLSPGMQGELDPIYRSDPAFYDDLEPTALCRGLMAAQNLPGRIAHIHAITHNYSNSDPSVASKERWLRQYLGGPDKLTIHNVEAGMKKSDILSRYCPEPHSFADDSMKNVVDILLNDKVRPHEILIPRMGHNAAPPEAEQLAYLRKIKLSYYENAL